jgi:hypothetical protein
MADSQLAVATTGQADEVRAMIDPQTHRLFEQEMFAGLESSAGNVVMEIGREDDVDGVDVVASEKVTVVGIDLAIRMISAGASAAFVRVGGDGDELSVLDRADRSGVVGSPGAIADETKTDVLHVDARDDEDGRPRRGDFDDNR